MDQITRDRIAALHLAAADCMLEAGSESRSHCDCCGEATRNLAGWIHHPEAGTIAAWFLTWTPSMPLDSHPAHFDLILGRWGEGTSAENRCGIAMLHFTREDGRPGLTIIDAGARSLAASPLISRALSREEAVGTPLAAAGFAIFDAVITRDERLR